MDDDDLSYGSFVRGYLGILGAEFALMVLLDRLAKVNPFQTAFVASGALLLLTSTGRPHYLFRVVRRSGWVFTLIRSDVAVRVMLGGMGLCLLAMGLLLTWPPGWNPPS